MSQQEQKLLGAVPPRAIRTNDLVVQKHFLYESLKITLCSFFAFLYICGCSFSVFAAILTKLKKKNKNASRWCAENKLNRRPSRKRKMK